MSPRTETDEWQLDGLSEWLTVVRAYQTCDKVLHRRLGDIGLTPPQYDLLMCLVREDGQTQQQLASRLLVVKSNVSSLLSRAERDGLIERRANPTDGRGKLVTLTRKGKRLARRGWAIQSDVVSTMFGVLAPREIREVAGAMRRVRDALRPMLDADA